MARTSITDLKLKKHLEKASTVNGYDIQLVNYKNCCENPSKRGNMSFFKTPSTGMVIRRCIINGKMQVYSIWFPKSTYSPRQLMHNNKPVIQMYSKTHKKISTTGGKDSYIIPKADGLRFAMYNGKKYAAKACPSVEIKPTKKK